MPVKYVSPNEVLSPRQNFTLITVLDEGTEHEGALAIGRWKDKWRDRGVVLVMRWNGNAEAPVGNPQSRGLPTWFVVPAKYQEAILSTLPADKLAIARVFISEPTD